MNAEYLLAAARLVHGWEYFTIDEAVMVLALAAAGAPEWDPHEPAATITDADGSPVLSTDDALDLDEAVAEAWDTLGNDRAADLYTILMFPA